MRKDDLMKAENPELDDETIDLAVEIAIRRIHAEKQFREFVADPVKAQAFKEYVEMKVREYERNLSADYCGGRKSNISKREGD